MKLKQILVKGKKPFLTAQHFYYFFKHKNRDQFVLLIPPTFI